MPAGPGPEIEQRPIANAVVGDLRHPLMAGPGRTAARALRFRRAADDWKARSSVGASRQSCFYIRLGAQRRRLQGVTMFTVLLSRLHTLNQEQGRRMPSAGAALRDSEESR
jgi:hypothetical protein